MKRLISFLITLIELGSIALIVTSCSDARAKLSTAQGRTEIDADSPRPAPSRRRSSSTS